MRVLLINPTEKHFDTCNEIVKKMKYSVPPLGLAYIASVLEKNKHKVKIYDGQTDINLINCIKEFKPEIVGITSSTPTFHRAVETATQIKALFEIPIFIGGPHATALPEKILKENDCFDFVIFGEGEYTTLELVSKKPLKGIKGLCYRKDGKIILNEPRELIKNLDELPFPARHLFKSLDKYNYVVFQKFPSAHLITSRGCPFSCIFCAHPFGKTIRTHSVEYVIGEIEELLNVYGAKDLQFYDENLMFDKERLRNICNEIIKRKLDFSWYCFGRADRADLELLKLMKKAGCWMISYGIESGNEEVLKFIKKGITKEQVREAVKNAQKAGIEARGSFIIGHPTDTKETIKETINFAKSLKLDHAAFSIAVPYPSSELYDIAEHYGTFRRDEFKSFKRQDKNRLSFVAKGFTEKELIKLHKQARIEFYFKSTYFLRALKNIGNMEHLKRYLGGAYSVIKGR